MLFKKQDLIHLQEQQEANSEVLETGVLLRFENKQSSADLDNQEGYKGRSTTLQPGFSWEGWDAGSLGEKSRNTEHVFFKACCLASVAIKRTGGKISFSKEKMVMK